MPPLQVTERHSTCRINWCNLCSVSRSPPDGACATVIGLYRQPPVDVTNPSANTALTGGFAAALRTPSHARDTPHECAPNRSNFSVLMWRSRLPSDPAFAVPAFALHLACAADLWEGRSGRSRRRGIIVSGRFRASKLVGSSQYSKRFFAAFLTGANASHSCPQSGGLSCDEGARDAGKVGAGRLRYKPRS